MHTQRQPGIVWLAIACGLAAAIVVGCGRGGPQRVVVTGAVSYRGQPVADGAIRFIPREGTAGPSTIVAIAGGRYTAEAQGGVPVGAHRVEIVAVRGRPSRAELEAQDADKSKSDWQQYQYLPKKYNVDSQLKTTIESSPSPVVRDFTLAD
jgi:hypothetical protein